MSLLNHAVGWIEQAWSEMGSSFNANDIPVAQFDHLDVDDLSFPFKNVPIKSWRLVDGVLVQDPAVTLARVPYVVFSLDEPNVKMHIQVQWAPRCGYGFVISFGPGGEVLSQNMRWVS